MKTRNFILATLALAGLAVSCKKSEVGGETPSSEDDTPVAIQLSTNIKVNKVSATKAGVDAWNEQELYIYALPTGKIPAADSEEILVQNAPATAPSGEVATTNPNAKKDITLYKEKTESTETYYYYPADKSTFDFYGYYVADAYKVDDTAGDTPNPTITENQNIVLPIKLDGSQDIMLAKADKEADVLEATELISPANAYGAYSARKGVKPNLVFQHQLSRFVFNVVAGNAEGMNVRIEEVTLTSRNEANLVIVNLEGATGITDYEEKETATFKLKEKDGSALSPWFPKNNVEDTNSYDMRAEDQIGESIMVIPEPNSEIGHKMVITMQQMSDVIESATPLDVPFTYVYDLLPKMVDNGTGTKPEAFLPGYQYNVNIVVYGRQQVDISVTLTPWGNGGTITIDNDKEWGDEPKLGYKATKGNADYHLYFYDNPIKVATETTPGTEVKVWDPANNKMVPADEGTYKFDVNRGTEEAPIWFVTLAQQGEGETVKTVVTGLSKDDPTQEPVQEEPTQEPEPEPEPKPEPEIETE